MRFLKFNEKEQNGSSYHPIRIFTTIIPLTNITEIKVFPKYVQEGTSETPKLQGITIAFGEKRYYIEHEINPSITLEYLLTILDIEVV